MEFLRAIQPRPDDLEKILDKVLAQYRLEYFEYESKTMRLNARLTKLGRQKRNLLAILSEPEFADDEEAKEMLIDVKNELAEVKTEMRKSIKGEFKAEYLIEYAKNFFKHLPLIWYEAKIGPKVRLQRMLFPEGLVYRNGDFSNTKLSPIFELIEEYCASNVQNVTPMRAISNSDVYNFLVLIQEIETLIIPFAKSRAMNYPSGIRRKKWQGNCKLELFRNKSVVKSSKNWSEQ